jgi:hypothetical protein
MAKTYGAVTKNKNVNWRVDLSDGNHKIYTNLKDLCAEQNINRSNAYKLAIGKSKPLRKKHIESIEKIYNKDIDDE